MVVADDKDREDCASKTLQIPAKKTVRVTDLKRIDLGMGLRGPRIRVARDYAH
jgi:hypothetical protein